MTAPTAGEPRWATVPEAAAYSGTPPTTIRRWISHGYVTAYRRGHHRLFVDLDTLDRISKPASPPRPLSEDDERLARQVAAASFFAARPPPAGKARGAAAGHRTGPS